MANFDVDSLLLLLQQGFWLGVVAGAIVGSFTWSLVNPGLPPIFALIIGGIVGLLAGIVIEGSGFFVSLTPSAIFDGLRANVLDSVVAVSGWMIGGLAIGAAVGNVSRAVIGALVGAVMGTAAGMIMITARDMLTFEPESSFGTVWIGVMTLLFVFLTSLGQDSNRLKRS